MTDELKSFIDNSKNTKETIRWVKSKDINARIYRSEERIENELAGILIDSSVISATDVLSMQEGLVYKISEEFSCEASNVAKLFKYRDTVCHYGVTSAHNILASINAFEIHSLMQNMKCAGDLKVNDLAEYFCRSSLKAMD